ncbi:predicted protein [Histoplasma capsulatum var. duboisii H88]|uniref:non-specific serine/threonine protein kinase n=1 Tax=Ajellomyces capsulatus (strain H88) TaxID=544711 RepID=F0UH12_AJEC8|nr:predicted protein [Histoplasma capsulatum var. duboisii H88]
MALRTAGKGIFSTLLMIFGPHGDHINLPSAEAIGLDTRGPVPMVRRIAKQLLLALGYIHSSCGIVHAGRKSMRELKKPCSRHTTAGLKAHLWLPSPPPNTPQASSGVPPYQTTLRSSSECQVSDSGKASWVGGHLTEFIQPRCLRAPEVSLEANGMRIYEVFAGKYLFDSRPSAAGSYVPGYHLSQMITLFGRFPRDLLNRGQASGKYFDSEGNSCTITVSAELPDKNCDSMSGYSLGGFIENKSFNSIQEKKDFVQFLQSMLALAPEGRKPAHLLLEESWLNRAYS